MSLDSQSRGCTTWLFSPNCWNLPSRHHVHSSEVVMSTFGPKHQIRVSEDPSYWCKVSGTSVHWQVGQSISYGYHIVCLLLTFTEYDQDLRYTAEITPDIDLKPGSRPTVCGVKCRPSANCILCCHHLSNAGALKALLRTAIDRERQ